MQDITLVCGNVSEISDFNKRLHDFAQIGYEPLNLSQPEPTPIGYDVCILLIKK